MSLDTATDLAALDHAAALRDQGRLTEMAGVLDAHLRAFPADGRAWALKAQSALLLRRDSDAVAAIQQALRLAPADALVQGNLARVHLRRNEPEAARAAAARALAAAPDDPEIRLVACGAEAAAGARTEALAAVDQVIAAHPGLAPAHATRAMLLLQLGQREAARAGAVRAVELGYMHPEGWRLLLGAGDRPGAVALLRRWLAVQPEDAGAMANLAELLRASGDSQEAAALLARALALAPDQPAYWHAYGAALQELHRLEEAARAYERVLALAPGFRGVEVNLAVLHQQRGDYPQAAEVLARHCAAHPEDAQAYADLGKLYERLDAPQEAGAAFARALAVDPDNLSALRSTGQVERALARYEALARETVLTPDALEDWLQLLLSSPSADPEAVWAAHAPKLQADARAQARLAAYPLIARWMRGDVDGVEALVRAHGAHVRVQERRDRNPFVFFGYVAKLHAFRRGRPDLYASDEAARPVHVLGESHALSFADLTAPWRGGPARFAPRLMMGAQMAFLGAGAANRWRTQLGAHLAALPRGADLLFAVGEIDCRPDQGIWQAHRRSREDPAALAERVVARYLDHLAEAAAGFGEIAVQGVPAPNYAFESALRPGEDPAEFLRLFAVVNAALAAGAADRGWAFLDVYGPTLGPGGRASGAWHIDEHHLSPAFYAELRLSAG